MVCGGNFLFFYREIKDGYAEYEGIISIPKRDYKYHNVIYNYYVEIDGKEVIKEFVLNHGNKSLEGRICSPRVLERKGNCKIIIGTFIRSSL